MDDDEKGTRTISENVEVLTSISREELTARATLYARFDVDTIPQVFC